MTYDTETLNRIYDRTAGRCHLCRKKLSFSNYGNSEGRGGWEVEHSNPRAKGGTDHGNNLFPACIPCNRAKGTFTTRTVRAWHGHTRAPLSKERQENAHESNVWAGAALAAFAGIVLSPLIKRLTTHADPHEDQQQGSPTNNVPVVLAVVACVVIGAVIAYHLKAE